MARVFTEEWYAERQRKQAQRIGRPTPEEKARMAGEWNGNIEPVEITSGGVEGHAGPRSARSPVRQLTAQAGIKAGPLTLQCRDDVKNQRRPSAAPSAASLYPLVGLCRGAGLPEPVPEFRFHATRKWRFDYAWPIQRVALEVDGGVWTQGRHTRGAGAIADMEKVSEAAILGWRVLYVVPDDLRSGVALDRVARALRPLEFAA